MLSEVSHKEKDKYYMMSLKIWNLEYDTNESIYETDAQTEKTNIRLPKGRGGEGRCSWNLMQIRDM